jgi:hypothetical protein
VSFEITHASRGQRICAGLVVLTAAWTCVVAEAQPIPPPVPASLPFFREEPVDFARDIRPILQGSCGACHGVEKQRGKLRLDSKRAALKGGESGLAIVPGKPDESRLIARVLGLGDEDRMPLDKPPLTSAQIDLLKRWIAAGASWPDALSGDELAGPTHWAYVAPVRPPLPTVENSKACRNAIDRFVLAQLEKEGLAPSPEADRATLLRRLSLDLIGLPPTLAEVDAFLADRDSDAYEKAVDRLLASPRYGERWARPWLDLARYADTNGYEKDLPRTLWPWRDWVIGALNADMPFDEFTVKQLAGDLLPNATDEDRIATGFHRNTMLNDEGGIDPEEFRDAAVVDRVNTTATVWLGTTMACCQCHDHKYDPFTQREYYAFYAFFDDTEDTGVGSAPEIPVPTAEQKQRQEELRIRIAALEKILAAAIAPIERTERERKLRDGLTTPVTAAGLLHHFDFEPSSAAGGAASAAAGPAAGSTTTSDEIVAGEIIDRGSAPASASVHGASGDPWIMGPLGRALRLDGTLWCDCGTSLTFERDRGFSYGALVRLESDGCILGKIADKAAYRGFDCFVNGGHVEVHIVNTWPANGIKVETVRTLPRERWTHVFVTYDGSSKASGVQIYVDGAAEMLKVDNDTLSDTIASDVALKIGSRDASGILKGAIDDVRVYDRALAADEVARIANERLNPLVATPAERRTAEDQKLLDDAWIALDPELRRSRDDLARAKKDLAELPIAKSMVMKERLEPRATHVHKRGNFRDPGPVVTAGTPAVLHPLPKFSARNRLALAAWLVDEKNPLVARVTVNRAWEAFFGQGLVATAEDFGAQGDAPVNPELLDWLATELVSRGWSMKALHRLIVTSATYRQSSRVTPALAERDPANRLSARAPRVRLDAETLRDNALSIAGLLSDKIGGPSVMPPQPPAIWADSFATFDTPNEKWVDAQGEDRWRRGIYTYWRRSAAYPSALTFDATRRDTCVVKRSRTNTPLQALVVLDDPVFVEAAIGLARRVLRERSVDGKGERTDEGTGEGPGDVRARLAHALRVCVAREPRANEIDELSRLFARTRERFARDPSAAEKLVKQTQLDVSGLDAVDLAAWTVIANVLLNLDETITKG